MISDMIKIIDAAFKEAGIKVHKVVFNPVIKSYSLYTDNFGSPGKPLPDEDKHFQSDFDEYYMVIDSFLELEILQFMPKGYVRVAYYDELDKEMRIPAGQLFIQFVYAGPISSD